MNSTIFDQINWGPLKEFLDDDDITDISYSNGGRVWLKSLSKGVISVERPDINNALMEKLAFQCSNVMGKTFNMASPFLDAESAELRLNFVHDSIAKKDKEKKENRNKENKRMIKRTLMDLMGFG